jgi:hypothetical protein
MEVDGVELVAPKAKTIKLGVDVHLDRYVVVKGSVLELFQCGLAG